MVHDPDDITLMTTLTSRSAPLPKFVLPAMFIVPLLICAPTLGSSFIGWLVILEWMILVALIV